VEGFGKPKPFDVFKKPFVAACEPGTIWARISTPAERKPVCGLAFPAANSIFFFNSKPERGA